MTLAEAAAVVDDDEDAADGVVEGFAAEAEAEVAFVC